MRVCVLFCKIWWVGGERRMHNCLNSRLLSRHTTFYVLDYVFLFSFWNTMHVQYLSMTTGNSTVRC